MYSEILIRYGELSTKGKNKMTFVRHLGKNVQRITGEKPRIIFDRMFLSYSEENMKNLQYVFGIHSYSPVCKVETNEEVINASVLKLLEGNTSKTFKVNIRRHWKGFEKPSMDYARELGGIILQNSEMKVNVKKPELMVEVEIRKDQSYIYVEKTFGLGGYPTGVNGKVLHLISGGIDSPIAALEMMKRGIHVDFLNFITPPHTDDRTKEKVIKIITLLNKYQGPSVLFRSNYTDLMNYIGLTSKQSYKITLMRRSFYRIASLMADKHKYLGLSNGENLGQVASQTLESIAVIQNQSTYPIYRPILTADKLETIEKAIKFGTYEISIEQGAEACELFAPKAPVIKPTIFDAEKLEKELDMLKDLEIKNIDENIEYIKID